VKHTSVKTPGPKGKWSGGGGYSKVKHISLETPDQRGDIKIKDLSLTLGNFFLHSLDLEIREGEYFVILGPTGTGKTVLVECLAGLHRIQKGEIWLNGRNITALRPEERGISYVPQDYALFPHLTVEGNIRLGLRAMQLSSSQAKTRIQEMTQMLGISSLLNRMPQTLSGGEKQRVALARALVIRPRLLLFDEPLTALDVEKKHELWVELKRIHEELGVTIIHITHDFEEAFTLGDRIAVIMDGKIQQVGDKREVFYRPQNPKIARFMGIKNIFEGFVMQASSSEKEVLISWNGHAVRAPFKPVRVGQKVTFCIRPEEVMVVRENRPLRPNIQENVISGKIVAEVPRGAVYTLFFQADDGWQREAEYDLEIQLPSHAYHRLGLGERRDIRVSLKKSAIYIF